MRRGASIFPKENKLNKIGGRLKNDYYTFRQSVLVINANYLPLFLMLGFCKPADKDFIIDTLLINKEFMYDVRDQFIDHIINMVLVGKVKIESVLKEPAIKRIEAKPEEREKRIRKEMQMKLKNVFVDIYKQFVEKYKPSHGGYNVQALRVCRETLFLSSNGFVIDVDKYISIYEEYIKLDESLIRRQQQAAADAINKFFNGRVGVTKEEFEKYFIIDHGVVKPNPDSINIEDYMRLGYRGNVKK